MGCVSLKGGGGKVEFLSGEIKHNLEKAVKRPLQSERGGNLKGAANTKGKLVRVGPYGSQRALAGNVSGRVIQRGQRQVLGEDLHGKVEKLEREKLGENLAANENRTRNG